MRKSNPWPFPAAAPSVPTAVVLAGVAAGAWLLYRLVTQGVRGTAAAVTSGVIDAGAGVVIGAGDAIGIPQTNQDACSEAMYAGRTLDASFACPAGTFLHYLWNGAPTPSPGLSGLPTRRRTRRRFALNRNC